MKQTRLPAHIEQWEHVSVHWQDAHETEGSHRADTYLRDFKPVFRKTAGFVLRYDDEYIIITHTDDRDGSQNEDDNDCTIILSLPICMVRKIVRLK